MIGPFLDASVSYRTIKARDDGSFDAVQLSWSQPRDALLSLRAVLCGESQLISETPWARVLEILDNDGEPIDEAAWLPAAPETWWLRAGTPILGMIEVARAAMTECPLLLCATPEKWLDNHRAGAYWPSACILRWDAPLDLWFSGIREIVAEEPVLQAALERHLVRTARPRYRIRPKSEKGRAA